MARLAPPTFSGDFTDLGDRVKLVEARADSIPTDIMDVHFMPTLFGEGD